STPRSPDCPAVRSHALYWMVPPPVLPEVGTKRTFALSESNRADVSVTAPMSSHTPAPSEYCHFPFELSATVMAIPFRLLMPSGSLNALPRSVPTVTPPLNLALELLTDGSVTFGVVSSAGG